MFLGQINDKQFQPMPATYLNQERWNDEIEIKDTRSKSEIFEEKIREVFKNGAHQNNIK